MTTQLLHRPKRAKTPLPDAGRPRANPASPRMERILVPVDFSETATDALRFALPFARETGARLDLLHVLTPLSLPAEAASLPREWSEYESRQRRDATARLKKLAAEVCRPARANVLLAEGDPVALITAAAREQRSDLVVVSTHGHTGLKRFFLGSTAEAVVRRAPCPVLTVRRRVLARGTPQSSPSDRINRILVPVDFSRPSRDMLRYAADFARRFRASLLLLHVVHHINVPSRVAYYTTRIQMTVLHEGMTRLAEWAEQLVPDDVEAEQIVHAGTPYEVINRMARRQQADLIIIATHGRTGLNRLFLGSTAERVLRHAPCPVLVVR